MTSEIQLDPATGMAHEGGLPPRAMVPSPAQMAAMMPQQPSGGYHQAAPATVPAQQPQPVPAAAQQSPTLLFDSQDAQGAVPRFRVVYLVDPAVGARFITEQMDGYDVSGQERWNELETTDELVQYLLSMLFIDHRTHQPKPWGSS